jgi:hypothetical protein
LILDFYKKQNAPESVDLFAEPEPGPSQRVLKYAFTQSMWAEAETEFEEAELNEGLTEAPVQLSLIEIELRKYLNTMLRPADPDANILAYWKSNVELVPFLASFARSILCIPASSACSERVFSAAGNVVTHKRTRILATKAEDYNRIQKKVKS